MSQKSLDEIIAELKEDSPYKKPQSLRSDKGKALAHSIFNHIKMNAKDLSFDDIVTTVANVLSALIVQKTHDASRVFQNIVIDHIRDQVSHIHRTRDKQQ